MAFTSKAFRRNRATAMVMELEADLAEAQKLDRGADRQVTRAGRFVRAVESWLEVRAPATSRAFVLLGGAIDGIRGYHAVDALRDRKLEECLADAKELAGLIDGVDERVAVSA